MLSGLSSLLFGNGGTGDAAVDQTLASPPSPLDTQDADDGWLLVDVAGDESTSQSANRPVDEPAGHLETAISEREMEHDNQAENQPRGTPTGASLRNRNASRAARAVRAEKMEMEMAKQARSKQRQQYAAKGKHLNTKHLELNNKACMVQGSGRKLASAYSRALRPSGRMNGRLSQRTL